MNRTCLTCVYWTRHFDQHIGTCQATNMPEILSYRAQHEDCTEGCYQFGAERPAARREYVRGWGSKVCAYFEVGSVAR